MELTDTDNQFVLPVPEGTCVAIPAASQDPRACAGLSLEGLAQKGDSSMRGLAYLPFEGDKLGVAVAHQPLDTRRPMSREAIEQYLSGMRKSAEAKGGRVEDFVQVDLAGAKALQFTLVLGPVRIVGYGLQGKTGMTSVSFVTDEAHLGGTKTLADRLMKGAHIAPLDDAETFGESHAYQMGFVVGKLVVPIAFLIVFCVVGVKQWRRRRLANR